MKKVALFAICAASLVLGADALEWTPGGPPQALSGWTILESEPISVEAALALAAEPGAAFVDYEGGGLPRSEAEGSRLYIFRASFSLPESAKDHDLALALGPGDYPRDLYLNGVRLLKTGVHGERYVSTLYYGSMVGLPPELLRYGSEANQVIVLARPAFETSPLGDIMLGSHEEASALVFLRNLFNVNLIQAAFVTALIIAVFFLFLFFRSPDKDRRYLWVALMCLAFSTAYFNMSFFNDAVDDVLYDKISRTGFTLTALFLLYFSFHFTGIWQGKRWLKLVLALPAAAGIVGNLLQSDKRGIAAWLTTFSTNVVLTPFLLITLGIFVAGFVKKRSADRLALLLGFLVTIGASLHDMAYVSARRIPFCYLIAYAYLLLLVAIFFVLALEQAATSRALARQSGALNERNAMLKEMVGDLTGVAEGLISSSASLEGTLDSTLRSVESFGEETRMAAEVFRLQMGAVESEIAQISERMALSAERVPKALDSQTQAVEEMNATLAEMKEKIDASGESAEESSRIAGELAKEAEGGRAVIGESRRAMGQVTELSGALQGVLTSIEDIAERTHVLSINAAIESARLGVDGKGFAVVAQEIRKLSEQSRTSLGSSFAKIAEMSESVGKSAELSDKAAETLGGIAEESRRSAERTEAIRRLIEEQREQGRAMLKDAEALLAEARLLKELSGEEKRSNEEREAQFRAMKESLQAVSRKLGEQEAHKRELGERLAEMRRSAEANAGHIAALRAAIDKVRVGLA